MYFFITPNYEVISNVTAQNAIVLSYLEQNDLFSALIIIHYLIEFLDLYIVPANSFYELWYSTSMSAVLLLSSYRFLAAILFITL